MHQPNTSQYLGEDLAQFYSCLVTLLVEGGREVGEEDTDGAHSVIKVMQEAVNLHSQAACTAHVQSTVDAQLYSAQAVIGNSRSAQRFQEHMRTCKLTEPVRDHNCNSHKSFARKDPHH